MKELQFKLYWKDHLAGGYPSVRNPQVLFTTTKSTNILIALERTDSGPTVYPFPKFSFMFYIDGARVLGLYQW